MVRVVGVRFKKAGKIYYFDPRDLPITAGCKVIVETSRGLEYGDVALGPKYVDEAEISQPLKPVIRIGTPADAERVAENKRRANEAFAIALEKIAAHGLDMHLVDVEYTFDRSKLIFYFTAEGRVDFRELVRDLAAVFRTRIEMRQIGVRDEAKLLGGIGPCGRILCCTSFLGEFAPVSIRMAKDQNLSLNPAKISGLCGRLMCCLRFEQEVYEAAKKDPTLAPGYVPPPLPADPGDGELAALEDDGASPWAKGVARESDSPWIGRVAEALADGAAPSRNGKARDREPQPAPRPGAAEGRAPQPATGPRGQAAQQREPRGQAAPSGQRGPHGQAARRGPGAGGLPGAPAQRDQGADGAAPGLQRGSGRPPSGGRGRAAPPAAVPGAAAVAQAAAADAREAEEGRRQRPAGPRGKGKRPRPAEAWRSSKGPSPAQGAAQSGAHGEAAAQRTGRGERRAPTP